MLLHFITRSATLTLRTSVRYILNMDGKIKIMDIKENFGEFLKRKRQGKGASLRSFAADMGISPVYMCNIEKGRDPAPSAEIINKMADALCLTTEERILFYDLAAMTKNAAAVPQDLPQYIMDRDIVRTALRTAKDVDATDEEWQEFISMLQNRKEDKK